MDKFENERKFLPTSEDWRKEKATIHHIRQGYLAKSHGNTVRVRISQTPRTTKGELCIKSGMTPKGVPEEEFRINVARAEKLLLKCFGNLIEKRRHYIKYKGLVFHVDEFLGDLDGKVLIEVELKTMDQVISLPTWVGLDVTIGKRYSNARFATKGWPEDTDET
jgi:adenylate cyclase